MSEHLPNVPQPDGQNQIAVTRHSISQTHH